MTRASFRQRYEQVEGIGAGGMGEVFKGYDSRSGRWVAIKLLHAGIAADKTSRLRFEREIKTQAEMDHTNIAQLFGVEDFKEGPCMIMQYVDGVGLNRLIAPGKALQPGIASRILDGVLAGMAHAHGAAIIHRDLKPSNILIGKRGIPKIIDFGIAKPEKDQDVTRMGSAPGTVSYMAPELHVASQPASSRSDVFSLGIICYELFTGTHPFRRDTEFATTQAILSHTPPPMRELAPVLPEALSAVVLTALEKDPVNRQKSAEELRAAITKCGILAAPEHDVGDIVSRLLVQTGGAQPDESASSSAVRAPVVSGFSRPVFGLLQLNWMIYAVVILLLTAGAVAYLSVSVRKPAQTSSAPVTAPSPPPAPDIPTAIPAAISDSTGDSSRISVEPAPPPTAGQPASQPSAGSPVLPKKSSPTASRASKADPAAELEEKRKKTLDALSGKLPDDK